MMLIITREFLQRVRNRAFVIGTLAFPLFMLAVIAVPLLTGGGGDERTIAVTGGAPPSVAQLFVEALTAPGEGGEERRYRAEVVPGAVDSVRPVLVRRLAAGEIDGFVVLPADVLDSNTVQYRARNVANFTVIRDVRAAASQAVQVERLARAGLQGQELARLVRRVEVRSARVSDAGEEGADAESSFIVAYVIAFLIYVMVAFYGMNVTRSVIEEKTSRIAEVLVSSVRATDLMLGKIIGVAAAALLQVLVWATLVVVAATQSELLIARLDLPPGALDALAIDPATLALLVLFFVLGFLLFAALFAALGAAMTTEQEAQSLQMVLIVPLFVPLLSLAQITGDPLGRTATAMGLFPLTAPIAMPMRMAVTRIPAEQIALSLALLAVGAAVVAWVAGKIYRIGILSTGTRPSLRELMHWIRTA